VQAGDGGGPGVLVVIPARLAATRLPGKPLLDATGRTLVQHVWDRAREIGSATAVLVATDAPEIADAVRAFGGACVLTSPDCASGTDRVAEAAAGRDEDLVVNLQGDEPEFEPADVDDLIAAMRADPSLPMGTIAAPAVGDDSVRPSVVKVVRDRAGRALYFSRAAIPHVRDPDEAAPATERAPVLRHVGIYAFRRRALAEFATLPPTPLERTEKLEQLRALENGWAIHVVVGRRAPPGIDTPEDYDAFRRRVAAAERAAAADGVDAEDQ
jgi:3-deoxy-manno-octulosonate cytidylyltransferase (CMP-KDO synthetase)